MEAEAMLREVRVQDAVGMVLAHDLTQILPGQFKGRLFKKGHVIMEEDIPSLLDIGKEHIYILSLQNGFIHEDEAATRLALAVMGEHLEWTEPHEGKVSLKSTIHGLAKVDPAFIQAVNAVDS
ncbi:MAG TPA: molybdopterin-binding protein, partial [Bacilli bacterium]